MTTYITSEIAVISSVIILLNLLFAPLGCVVIWQKQTYFCEGIAHGCFLAVALTMLTGLPVILTVLFIAMLLAFLLYYTQKIHKDSVTSTHVLAHGMVALSIIIFHSLSSKYAISINSLFFGDILSTTNQDFMILLGACIVILWILYKNINKFILVSFSHDFAFAQGIQPFKIELLLLSMVAITVAITIKIIGTLLIAALITITPAIARPLSKTPKQMMLFSVIIGIVVSLICFFVSLIFDLPPTPLTAAVEALIFIIVTIFYNKRNA